MKSLSWGLLIGILFAINIYEQEAAKTHRSHTHRRTGNTNFMKPRPQQRRTDNRRISEKKCHQYLLEASQPARGKRGQPYLHNSISALVHSFVIGGRDALQGEFPHMGAVGWRSVSGSWIFKCGSSLISPKFAVTAAHCSKIKKDNTIAKRDPEIVRLGEKNIIDVYANGVYPMDAYILRIIVHPKYSSPNKYYDIALINFKSDIKFSKNIQPVCLWTSSDTSRLGTRVSSTGWGVFNTASKKTSPILKAALMDIIDSEQCSRLLRKACDRRWCGIQQHQLCAGQLSGGVDACAGDSGGPLQVKIPSQKVNLHYLIGVTSFGVGCARPNMPGVYTRVSSFVNWIESIVWPGQ